MSRDYIWTTVCLLIATGYCSYIGDDDVVYQYLYRKPTPTEGFRRVRFGVLKLLASIHGGFVLAFQIQHLLMLYGSITLTRESTILLAVVLMAVVSLLISVLENGIRMLRGRPTRPLIDPVVWQRGRGPSERKQ